LINLRAQGVITGSGPITVRVDGISVRDRTSPLVSAVPAFLQSGVSSTVCLQVTKPPGNGIEFSRLGVDLQLTLFNADAPGGVSGRVTIETGSATAGTSPGACADVTVVAPTANAGGDKSIADTDRQVGETVQLNGTASRDTDGRIVSYQWLETGREIGTGATTSVRLADGVHALILIVTDDSGASASDSVTINIAAPSGGQLTANAGADQRVGDTDGIAGENVTLNASNSVAAGSISSYQWLANGQVIGQGASPSVRLPNGDSLITLTIADSTGNTASDSVLVSVAAPNSSLLVANAGADQNLADTDSRDGEAVLLNASASSGTITAYRWLHNGQEIANGLTASVRLADGDHVITLVVIDAQGATGSDVMQISIARATTIPILADLPGLTPNERSVAVALDSLCPRLQALSDTETPEQGDLRKRCQGIRTTGVEQQVRALDELGAQDLNAVRTQTFNLSRAQLATLSDRLIALRSGARGLSLAGFNLESGDTVVPLELVAENARTTHGGGASADQRAEQSAADLLNDDVGLWLRGNISFGSKRRGTADSGFKANQWGVLGGIDYRFSPVNIVGMAAGYGRSQATFSPAGSGDLDTTAMTAALYATMYTKSGFYFDAIASYLRAGYSSDRRISYAEDDALIDASALGATAGGTMGVAATFGYDIILGALTIAPTMGYNYMVSQVDGFREHGAAGLDLEYNRQSYVSATVNSGLRLSYALKTAIGVFIPQLRGEYVREFIEDTQAFGVRFANDPFKDTPLIKVTSDVPDLSYMRVAGGISAQLLHGISGFCEYQRMIGQELFSYADLAFGLRIEASFR